MTRTTRTTLTLAAAMLAACGGASGYSGSPTSPPPGNGRTITASPSLTFGPASLTVAAGDTVTFAFGPVAHNVFFDAQTGAPSDIDGVNADVSITRAFATRGTYHYICGIHAGMEGTVVVR